MTRVASQRSGLLSALALGSVTGLLATTSCGQRGAPCAAPACGAGYECLANTCMPVGTEPVPRDTARIVLEPVLIASARGEETSTGSVHLGRPRAGLYLRFDGAWRKRGSVVRAFLLLEPGDTDTAAEDLPLDVWTVLGPWLPSRIAIGARPNIGGPHARGILRTSPRAPARIDVTKMVVAFAEKPTDDGLAVVAGDTRESDASVRTGSDGGAPRLELYLHALR